jgi:hypothetical protein
VDGRGNVGYGKGVSRFRVEAQKVSVRFPL